MSRRRQTLNRHRVDQDFGRKPFIAKEKGYRNMMVSKTLKAQDDASIQRHSQFEKPYRTDSYGETQRMDPSNFDQPYRDPEPEGDPTAGPCHGNLAISPPTIEVQAGESRKFSVFTEEGVGPPFEWTLLAGIGEINSVTGLYQAPVEVEEDTNTIIGVRDGCRIRRGIIQRAIRSFLVKESVDDKIKFLDTFVDTNGTTIDSHTPTPDGEGVWSVFRRISNEDPDATVQSNTALFNTARAAGVDLVGYVNDIGNIADGFVSADCVTPGSNGNFGVKLVFRYQDSSNFYYVEARNRAGSGSDFILIVRVVAGSGVSLALDTSFTFPSSSFSMKATFSGSDLELFINGSSELTASDSTFATGAFGMEFIDGTATQNNTMDNFTAEED